METTPPFQVVPGQRLLAAIMFTDAVSFSARVHVEEVATLSLLERDFAIMRGTISNYSGTVLKSTGDGLLVTFTSAVQAVECALQIQRRFAPRHQPVEAGGALRHRIGVHLGDVFVTSEDVMGDGVNIAARLLAEAPPGGISISQTVLDVVRNKLQLHVRRLGPRQLKNIQEMIPVYHVLLTDPQPAAAPAADRPEPGPLPGRPPRATGPQPWTRAHKLALAGAILLILAAAGRFLLQAHFAHEDELLRSQASQEALRALLQRTAARTAAAPAARTDSAGPHVPGGEPAIDFAALATRPAGAPAPAEAAAIERHARAGVQELLAWLPTGLGRYNRERPLVLRPVGTILFQGATVFPDAQGRLNFAEGGAVRPRAWDDLRPAMQAAIVVTLLQDSPAPVPPPVRRGAEAFAYLHQLPEMIAALRGPR